MASRIKLLQQVARATEFGWQEDAIDEAILILRALREAKPALLRAVELTESYAESVGGDERYGEHMADAATLRALAERGDTLDCPICKTEWPCGKVSHGCPDPTLRALAEMGESDEARTPV